ncbi:MAG: HAMP domain-containing protein [Desulfobulbaceae bacterium]|jgi:two-component system nitrogen regulation sensor histidine kinase NtrY|nr:HAMP domain-containing protein [Desulfobulbaceae bacterium]
MPHPENPPTDGDPERETAHIRQRKRKALALAFSACLLLAPFLIWAQVWVYDHDSDLPVGNDIVVFALISLNQALILAMLYVVLRYLGEMFFARNTARSGLRLQTRLVASFLTLSFLPVLALFFVSWQFIATSIDYWFSATIDQSLRQSLSLAQSILDDGKTKARLMNERLLGEIRGHGQAAAGEILKRALSLRALDAPVAVRLIAAADSEIAVTINGLNQEDLPEIPFEVRQRAKRGQENDLVQDTPLGKFVSNLAVADQGLLVTSFLIKGERLRWTQGIIQGIERYRQLKHFKEPLKLWLICVLLLITLLILFAAIWTGIYIARGITRPVGRLASAIQRVAAGDLDVVIEKDSDDEIGALVVAFNQMTGDLKAGDRKLAEARAALEESSKESERRRRYIEIILQSVSTGVISMDNDQRISTVNRSAEKLLKINGLLLINRNFKEILNEMQSRVIQEFIDELNHSRKGSIEKPLKLTIRGKRHSLLVNFIRLLDETGAPLGYVLVFDDLSKLEQMQRIAAWRDVAQRIAHEIKNPLTPIQLSAQRLRKRYLDRLDDESGVFDQCTSTIIRQVEEMKELVAEFSRFARMPKMRKTMGDLKMLVADTLFMYREAHKLIRFTSRADEEIPVFSFDGEQIRRCLINLLDNAVAVLPSGGTISVALSWEKEHDAVSLAVADDGPGVSREDKQRLFEPHFSTKKSGTGLGLAIVSTIMADHGGGARVEDNHPRGTVLILDLPLHPSDDAPGE